MRQILPGNRRKAMRTGARVYVLAVADELRDHILPLSEAAPMGPGLRWWMPGMAL